MQDKMDLAGFPFCFCPIVGPFAYPKNNSIMKKVGQESCCDIFLWTMVAS